MKKALSVLLAFALVLACASCENNQTPVPPTSEESPSQESAASENSQTPAPDSDETVPASLIVYFSHTGTTKSVALEIQAQTGADIFEIVPAVPYTDDYDTLLDVAREEQQSDARPELSESIPNLDSYDVVYVGFPIWWGDMPMILYTFFDTYDLAGKTVIPFVTSGGSGFSDTISTMESLEPNATFLDGLALGSSAAANPSSAVADWLREIGQ